MSRSYNERKHFEQKWVRYRLDQVSQSWMGDDPNGFYYTGPGKGKLKRHNPWSCVPNCPCCMSPRHNKTISNKKWKLTMQEIRSNISYEEWKKEAGL